MTPKLRWTKEPDGSEVAGPFKVKDETLGYSFWRVYVCGAHTHSYSNADDAKSAAERIAAAIMANVKEGDHDAKSP